VVVQAPEQGLSVVGFAVAGGRSRRMGRDKALLPWAGSDLLDHALERLAKAADEVRILSGAERRHTDRGVPVEVDPSPALGPMGGLLAALESARDGGALLLGIDLPLVPVELLTRLVSLSPEADAIVPVSPRGPEPLCAFYGPGCLDPVRRAVSRGDLRMTAFWADVAVRQVGPDELAVHGPPSEVFLNVNTPEDYDRAQRLARG
jgi:molybdopterin-guanine dinucleotide biosynthesis protein A